MLAAYASGHEQVQETVKAVLKALNVGPEVLFLTLGRTAARCVETVVMTDKLAASAKSGDLKIHEWVT